MYMFEQIMQVIVLSRLVSPDKVLRLFILYTRTEYNARVQVFSRTEYNAGFILYTQTEYNAVFKLYTRTECNAGFHVYMQDRM